MNDSISIVLWNTEWALADSPRGTFFRQRFTDLSSDVICMTEGYSEILPRDGYVITSADDYGYRIRRGRRKVLLWSRQKWNDVDDLGATELPPGRFVAGTTDTPVGQVRFVGVCIPWRDAHVSSGQRNREPWEDHLTYLHNLSPILKLGSTLPVVVLGDFNQRIPRARQPERVYSELISAFSPHYQFSTAGEIPGAPQLSIDHLAINDRLRTLRTDFLSSNDESGARMSDHFGLRVLLQKSE